MKQLNRQTAPEAKLYPERIIQIGEGNFLRAFVDWMVSRMNREIGFNSGVVVVQPRPGNKLEALNAQEGLFHVNLQGLSGGKAVDSVELVDCVTRGVNPYENHADFLALAENPDMRFVVSNTTEAGIAFDPACQFGDAPALSYPGKLTQLLYHRFEHFSGDTDKGLIILPCELIFRNGDRLKECILQYIDLWQLGNKFRWWFEECCPVYCTLVDRIVPGFPKDRVGELQERTGYDDRLFVVGETYHLWVIEAPANFAEELPAARAGLNVKIVSDEEPYHQRKVTLLNGPHTVMSPVGFLSGVDTVRECLDDKLICRFVHKAMFDELMPTLNLPVDELREFADDVLSRFGNPFVRHMLTSIMLNSFSKYATRDLPALKTYLARKHSLPRALVLGLAAIITYYHGGKRGDDVIQPNDSPEIMQLLNDLWATFDISTVANGVLSAKQIWGEDLTEIPGLEAMLIGYLYVIATKGMRQAVMSIF